MFRRLVAFTVCLCLLLVFALPASAEDAHHYNPAGMYPSLSTRMGHVATWATVKLDSSGIPTVSSDGKTYEYNPTTISIFGLQEYMLYFSKRDKAKLESAKVAAKWLMDNMDPKTGGLYYKYNHNVAETNLPLKGPWLSALSQGMSTSLFVRLYSATHDTKYLNAARLAAQPFAVDIKKGGVKTTFFGTGTWFEEYPTDPPPYVLNGFLFALHGLYDLASIDPQSSAEQLFKDGMETLAIALPRFDLGDISAYHLGHLTVPRKKVFINKPYHAIHVDQLANLATLTDDPTIAYYRDLWRGYLTKDGARAK